MHGFNLTTVGWMHNGLEWFWIAGNAFSSVHHLTPGWSSIFVARLVFGPLSFWIACAAIQSFLPPAGGGLWQLHPVLPLDLPLICHRNERLLPAPFSHLVLRMRL